jgi:hypothetical protein
VRDEFGLDGEYYALVFDNAVIRIGVWIENKSNEMDDKGRYKYKLEDLLQPQDEREKPNLDSLSEHRGAYRKRVIKRKPQLN